jgi:rubrerythrin
MELEEAIKGALQYEQRVHELYLEAEKAATDDVGRRVFGCLAREESGHIAYLNSRLEEWQQNHTITLEKLETVIPCPVDLEKAVTRLKESVEPRENAYVAELGMLQRALKAEIETGEYYQKLVNELPAEHQPLFARFLEIEDGHRAIVQAEIDSVSGLGFWFDSQEFGLERG